MREIVVCYVILVSFACHCSGEEACYCNTTTFDRDVLKGDIVSPNYPEPYCAGLICIWLIDRGDPWTAIKLKFLDFDTQSRVDVIEFWQIDSRNETFMDWFSGPGQRQDIVTGLGHGLKVVFRSQGSSGRGFRFTFHRFSAASWSGINEEGLKKECESAVHLPSVFLAGSCFTLGPPGSFAPNPDYSRSDQYGYYGSSFEEAFYSCHLFPHGHLPLVNNRELAMELLKAFQKNFTSGWGKWVGLNQTTKILVNRHEDSKAGWHWVLPDGQSWAADYEVTRWDKLDQNGAEPDNWGGQDRAAIDTTHEQQLLADTWRLNRYQFYCEYESLYACPSILYDVDHPGFISAPTPSTADTHCHYVLRTDYYKSVELTLTELKLGSLGSIRVYDGDKGTSVAGLLVIWVDSLQSVFNSTKPTTVRSRTNALTVVFTSATSGSVFRAKYARVASSCKCKNETIELKRSTKGEITSPGYPANYCGNLDCTWDLETADNDLAIQLKIESLDTLNNGDWLTVRDIGFNSSTVFNETIIAHFTEQIGAAKMLESDHDDIRLTEGFRPVILTIGHKAQVFFHSDAVNHGKGFRIKYKAVRRAAGCDCPQPQPSYHSELEGSFEFQHTQNNCETIDCIFVLPVPEVNDNEQLRLKIRASVRAIQPNGYLRISEGLTHLPKSKRFILQRFEIQKVRLDYIKPPNDVNGLTFHYHTEAEGIPIIGLNGFVLNYKWTTECECGESELEALPHAKIFTSPNFPNEYCPNANCKWKITAKSEHSITVEIVALESENGFDQLEFLDGSDHLIQKFSGYLVESQTIESSSNILNVRFLSSEKLQMQGFQLRFYSKAPVKKSYIPTVLRRSHWLLIIFVVTLIIWITLVILSIFIVICDLRRRQNYRRRQRLEEATEEEKQVIVVE